MGKRERKCASTGKGGRNVRTEKEGGIVPRPWKDIDLDRLYRSPSSTGRFSEGPVSHLEGIGKKKP